MHVYPICYDDQQTYWEICGFFLQRLLTGIWVVADGHGLICMQITFKWFLSQTVCPFDSFYINYWHISVAKSSPWKNGILLLTSYTWCGILGCSFSASINTFLGKNGFLSCRRVWGWSFNVFFRCLYINVFVINAAIKLSAHWKSAFPCRGRNKDKKLLNKLIWEPRILTQKGLRHFIPQQFCQW